MAVYFYFQKYSDCNQVYSVYYLTKLKFTYTSNKSKAKALHSTKEMAQSHA